MFNHTALEEDDEDKDIMGMHITGAVNHPHLGLQVDSSMDPLSEG